MTFRVIEFSENWMHVYFRKIKKWSNYAPITVHPKKNILTGFLEPLAIKFNFTLCN